MMAEEAYVGQRVRPSASGLANHPRWSPETRGTVVGFSARFTWCIRVRRDGVKEAMPYAASFWTPDIPPGDFEERCVRDDSDTKLISWHDADGRVRVVPVPREAVCLTVGAHCPICYEAAADKLLCVERILAIGLEHVVCTGGVHPVPPLVVVLRDETRRDVDVFDTRGGSW